MTRLTGAPISHLRSSARARDIGRPRAHLARLTIFLSFGRMEVGAVCPGGGEGRMTLVLRNEPKEGFVFKRLGFQVAGRTRAGVCSQALDLWAPAEPTGSISCASGPCGTACGGVQNRAIAPVGLSVTRPAPAFRPARRSPGCSPGRRGRRSRRSRRTRRTSGGGRPRAGGCWRCGPRRSGRRTS